MSNEVIKEIVKKMSKKQEFKPNVPQFKFV